MNLTWNKKPKTCAGIRVDKNCGHLIRKWNSMWSIDWMILAIFRFLFQLISALGLMLLQTQWQPLSVPQQLLVMFGMISRTHTNWIKLQSHNRTIRHTHNMRNTNPAELKNAFTNFKIISKCLERERERAARTKRNSNPLIDYCNLNSSNGTTARRSHLMAHTSWQTQFLAIFSRD